MLYALCYEASNKLKGTVKQVVMLIKSFLSMISVKI